MCKLHQKLSLFLLSIFNIVLISTGLSQNKDSISGRNIALTTSCSVLEGNGIRIELPGYFYSSKTHGFSIAPTAKFLSDNSSAFGVNAGYYYFLEPSFRDISFFLNYNLSYFFETNAALTHIINIGTQIDIGKRCFLQHSIGLGFRHLVSDQTYLNTSGQLKLTLGLYLREIPVVHIHDDWEH
jgi:hypothetical protein